MEQAVENIELAKQFLGNYVVGVEFSGNPEVNSFQDFLPAFEKARELGLKISIHTAEIDDSKKETDAILDFKPDRIGHGCFMRTPQIERAVELGIPIEVCPTSNLSTSECGVYELLSAMFKFHEKGHNIIFCTDDTMLFNTNLGSEIFEASKVLKMNALEVRELPFFSTFRLATVVGISVN